MYEAVGAVVLFNDAYGVFESAYPTIASGLKHLWGLIMPEYFWDGFRFDNKARMKIERASAQRRTKQIEAKYSSYSVADKLAIEKVYRQILRQVTARGL